MPISGNIYQGLRVPRESGFATLGDFWNQFQDQRDRREDRALKKQDRELRQQEIDLRNQTIQATQRKLKNDDEKIAATKKLMQEHTTPEGIDFEGVLEGLYAIDQDAAIELDKHLEERAKAKREAKKAEFDQKKAEFEFQGAQLDRDAKDRTSYLERFAAAKSPEQWAEIWQDASDNKMQRVLKGAGLTATFSPESVKMAGDLVLGVKGRAEADAKAATAEREDTTAANTEAYRQSQLDLARQRLAQGGSGGATAPVSVIGPDGKPVYVKPQDAYGKQPANLREQGPSTGAAKRVLNFFNRAKQASEDLEGLETWLGGLKLAGQTRLEYAPNVAQTPEGRQYIQAQRAFTEARLRKDSGAAIPTSEYDNDRKTYFPQPGDDANTLAQKKRARAAVLASLAFESGAALKEFYGDDADGMIQEYRRQSGKDSGSRKIGRFEVTVEP